MSVSSPPAYERRIVDDELDELIDEMPAIALEGPKGVGKTGMPCNAPRQCIGSTIPRAGRCPSRSRPAAGRRRGHGVPSPGHAPRHAVREHHDLVGAGLRRPQRDEAQASSDRSWPSGDRLDRRASRRQGGGSGGEARRDVSGDDVKHLNWLEDKLGDRVLHRIVVTTGPRAYRRREASLSSRSCSLDRSWEKMLIVVAVRHATFTPGPRDACRWSCRSSDARSMSTPQVAGSPARARSSGG